MKPNYRIQFFWNSLLRAFAAFVILTASAAAISQTKEGVDAKAGPHQVVESVTDQLLSYLKENSGRLEKDPKGYYSDIRVMLEPVIAFPYIARNVMAGYWDYSSPEQKKQFVEVFTENLVETYVKGMANYANFEVSVVPPKEDKPMSDAVKVNVVQLVKNQQGDTKVVYSLRRKDTDSDWQLVNVWLGSSNLGKSLKSQFDGAVKGNLPKLEKSQGDEYSKDQVSAAISAAIQNWGKA